MVKAPAANDPLLINKYSFKMDIIGNVPKFQKFHYQRISVEVNSHKTLASKLAKIYPAIVLNI